MRSPKVVLDNLASKAKTVNYKYQRLYRNLYNIELYLEAYARIYANQGNMTQGTDGNTVDDMSINRIQRIINKLKNQSYQPNPARRVYIPKKNGSQRPLGIPSIDDKLVQEIVRRILEAIYESTFSNKTHGFRPNRSCHTALEEIRTTYTGIKWWLEGDIKGFFDNIDHHILINILRRRIDDEKFIDLIWKFLKAGYMEEWKFHNTYSGTPQGGTISPILSNIYLNELDKYMEEYKKKFDKGKTKQRSTAYRTACQRTERLRAKYKKIWHNLSDEEKQQAIKEVKKLQKEVQKLPRTDPQDGRYKRLQYTRYADDFLIGIIGSKDDARKIKQDLTIFLMDNLKLELSQRKTLITNSRNKARFLGYDIQVDRSNKPKVATDGIPRRTFNLKVRLLMPMEKWRDKLLQLQAMEIDKNDKWIPMHRRYLVNNDDLEIISTYNAEIRGFYNYYKLALNVSNLNKFHYVMKFSLLKTYANKYRSTIKKMKKKFNVDGEIGVRYRTKEEEKIRFFYNKGYKIQRLEKKANENVDNLPNITIYSGRTSLIDRLLAGKCEWCGVEDVPIHMHHVRKLKDLQGKKRWEQLMIGRKRKTLALCQSCHKDLHNGMLD